MNDELFPIVDCYGNVVGSATRGECHSGSMLLHPVVHLHVIDGCGSVYLQKRSMSKLIQPGKWDTAVGGHVDYGEQTIDALYRETREELGIEISNPEFLCSYLFKSSVEYEYVNVFCINVGADFAPILSPEEISDGRFWTVNEIEQAMGKGVLTPNFEQEFCRIKPYVLNKL